MKHLQIEKKKTHFLFWWNDDPVISTVQYFLIILEMLFVQVLMEENYG